jgi:hypothetical protein
MLGSLAYKGLLGALLLGAGALQALPAVAQPAGRQHSPGSPYAAGGLPDRITLTPAADPSTGMAIAFRTDSRQEKAQAEIAPAIDGPSLAARAVPISGRSFDITTENGAARYHQLRFAALKPDTAYVYRVKGAEGWSEWLQFRTAVAEPRPFTFLYFGDTQNDILEVASRVIRQGIQSTASPALVLHAGDLVAQRDEKVHDDEWGEWAQTGGYNYATIPQLPAAGNHEYVNKPGPGGKETYELGSHWPLSFTLPDNGANRWKATTYFVDYQGVRFIVLDGTAALELGAIGEQSRWLEQTLAGSKARWNVVLFHQPLYTCARGQDTEELKAAWKATFEKHRVDLVLQGHDHCYSRLTSEQGRDASDRARATDSPQGPVYLVSVTGSKMYGLNDRASTQPDRVAEDTELYQRIDVAGDRLTLRSYTATGRLYDDFALERRADGRNRLVSTGELTGPIRRCNGTTGPDGLPCTARSK